MANKEKIDYLLLDIKELENQVASMRDAEVYPVSFFSRTFTLAHKILNDLHAVETIQLEQLHKQMEEHQKLLNSIPLIPATEQPVFKESEPSVPQSAIRQVEPEPMIQKAAISESPTRLAPVAIPEVKETAEGQHKPLLIEKQGISFNEILEKQNLSDFRKAFSLNDRFRFRRELFGGDEARMNRAISDLNEIHSYEESVTYLNTELKWNVEDAAVADFIKLLEKRFL